MQRWAAVVFLPESQNGSQKAQLYGVLLAVIQQVADDPLGPQIKVSQARKAQDLTVVETVQRDNRFAGRRLSGMDIGWLGGVPAG